MAILPTIFHSHPNFEWRKTSAIFTPQISPLNINTKLQFPCSITRRRCNFHHSNTINQARSISVSNACKKNQNGCDEIFHIFKRWRDFIPGGNWWNLCDSEQLVDGSPTAANPVTVLNALSKMWALVADQQWVLYTAFGALTVAALSEISIPSILTASIFSAHSCKTTVFCRNSWLLVFLCSTSGICSGLRSGCFAFANTILVKRLRETLYSSLLLQDISFFEIEAVGDLTSRLGTDCQRLSNSVGNDIHLILRNILQGTGAFINLMTLSWPLAVSSLVICSTLSAIFLVYGRYQKKAATLAQRWTASANEVAQETLSSIRTVRAYGTETDELRRFTQGLERLASISTRESIAYGFWNFSFSALFRMTQVFAVLLGGMSIFTGNVSAEQLMKYVFYCEWLIFAAWRVQDSMSSLLQSIGACEKVFQLMNLSPSDQFLSKGLKLEGLKGDIEFENVSFNYSSRKMVPVMKNVNLKIQSNNIIAIVGASGSGKTTLINLLLQLYNPTSGQILIDGIPLRELDIRWLREKIGFVSQEPQIFRTDFQSNIIYGCSRSIRQEEIEWAAKQAYVHEFISSLPSGYYTPIDGNLLSRGQKQRIAIARAILRDPTILILDEATSALDAESEYYIKVQLEWDSEWKKD
ncbi:ABC transporter B family member 26 [Forsythia ovata]|uniref:ABC transporter B family member 26 n=1 Tax=Forsythia ovata TaxID=205694 RepID=A0ABD1WRX6_9LAMI